ncbi:MAG: hemolysin family protein [Simkaniaceae bacterium]
MSQPLLIFLLIALILFSGFLSGSETALFSLSSMKVRAFRQGTDARGKLIAKLLSQPRRLLVTILMLNVLMNILVQNVVSGIFGLYSSWLLTVGVPLALTLIFGEIIPKSLAYAKNTWIAYHAAPILRGVEWLLKPVRDAITFITTGVSRFFFFYLRNEKEISIEELKYALRTSRETGVVVEEEAKLIRGYLNLEDDLVKELMCPRGAVLYFDINEPLSKLIHFFVDDECTRVPVCNGSLENVLGLMTSGSFFLHRDRIQTTHDVIPFLRKLKFVPESMVGKALLQKFYEEEETMMMVVDEYGSVSGLITLEDLVETVIGQIADRRDDKSHYTRASEDIIIASGKLELTEFEEMFDVHLESPNNMATIGGWLTELTGDIPKSGTKIEDQGFLFHVLASDVNRVRRVYIRRLKPKKKRKYE